MILLGSVDSFFLVASIIRNFLICHIEEVIISHGYVVHFRVNIFLHLVESCLFQVWDIFCFLFCSFFVFCFCFFFISFLEQVVLYFLYVQFFHIFLFLS